MCRGKNPQQVGSPPHQQGTHKGLLQILHYPGFTLAYARSTNGPAHWCQRPLDYPHLRRECRIISATGKTTFGSPPLCKEHPPSLTARRHCPKSPQISQFLPASHAQTPSNSLKAPQTSPSPHSHPPRTASQTTGRNPPLLPLRKR